MEINVKMRFVLQNLQYSQFFRNVKVHLSDEKKKIPQSGILLPTFLCLAGRVILGDGIHESSCVAFVHNHYSREKLLKYT